MKIQKIFFSFYIPVKLVKALKRLAKNENRTVSSMGVILMQEGLDNRKLRGPVYKEIVFDDGRNN